MSLSRSFGGLRTAPVVRGVRAQPVVCHERRIGQVKLDFDPEEFEARTQRQWDEAADGWHRWSSKVRKWSVPATKLMIVAPQATP